jgi:hypothetical protein
MLESAIMGTTDNGAAVPSKLTLRELPLPARLTLSVFLLAVGLGYFSALMQLHFKNATRGEPLPTANDVVEIFSGVENWPVPKPAPPRQVSKLERLLMGPEDESTAKGESMAKPFFKGDADYMKKIEKDPQREPALHEEREGERQAIVAWINLPDEERKAAYENDELTLPAALVDHPISKEVVDPNGQIRVNFLIQARCAKCHDDAGKPGKKRLVDYEEFAEVLFVPTVGHTSRQMSVDALTQTTHLHLLSFCMLWMLTGLIFAFSSYWKWFRCILAPVVLLAQVADVACWWLARLDGVGPYFALVIIGTGTVVGVGLILQIVLSLFDMYRLSGKVVLVLLFGALLGGGVYLAPRIGDYLNREKAPTPGAPTAPAK